ncbi:hypothetical protein [Laedolimicola ammoniilytica]|uniref:Uncharacterized protein n=1 Tax=Laedolimicola ammoniilytica TaxID=2981771 RepID=A0ABT2RY91_9FIRM|nr:hypothetical protein [Laedolimicola ammoniilytica]MCU6697258.1 hypothetical protein [Laedolimicola ammoniilytica]SCI17447.1 Uncharacterised protein [uncultured Clostridium sp.]
MTVKEMKRFLDKFPEEQDVVVIAVRPQARKKYNVTGLVMLTELAYPVIGVELGAAHEFDEQERACAEADERTAQWSEHFKNRFNRIV